MSGTNTDLPTNRHPADKPADNFFGMTDSDIELVAKSAL
jgi:hypothetical protein